MQKVLDTWLRPGGKPRSTSGLKTQEGLLSATGKLASLSVLPAKGELGQDPKSYFQPAQGLGTNTHTP